MKIERFEDLICWQRARTLTNVVYELTRLTQFAKDFELVRQIRAAGISTMSNIAEGFERWTRKEFVRFLEIAKGSAGEVRSQLYVALDQRYISPEQFESACEAALEVSKTIAGLIRHLAESTPYKIRETTDDEPFGGDLPDEFVQPGTGVFEPSET